MHKNLLLLTIIIVFGLAVFYRLGSSPPGVLVDEASLGYNAFSILKTGKDEWGSFLPFTLKSFGDYKPAGYIYFAIPFIKFLGLTPFSVRLPSAISGVISVVCVYFLIHTLSKNKLLALLSCLIVAVSPWQIYMSRMAWEANLSLSLFLVALALLLSKPGKKLFLLLSSFLFSTSMFVYVGYKFLIPVFLPVFLCLMFKNKKLKIKNILFFVIFLTVFSLPQLSDLVSKGGASRFSQVNIFAESGTVMFVNEQRQFCAMQQNKILTKTCYLFWNKFTVSTTMLVKNYLMGFSTDFLFFSGDGAGFINNPNHGGLYYWLFPFFLVGLTVLIKKRREYFYQFILFWLILSPLMSSIAGKPHFVRSNMILIPTAVVCALGVFSLWQISRAVRKSYGKLFLAFFILISYLSLAVTMVDYLFVYTRKAMAWDEYYPAIFADLKNIDQQYEEVQFKKISSQPYIYLLFYQAIDPEYFRHHVLRKDFEVQRIEKYNFIDNDFNYVYCDWVSKNRPKTLFVTNEINDDFAPRTVVTSFNGVHKLAAIYDLSQSENYLLINKPDKVPVCTK